MAVLKKGKKVPKFITQNQHESEVTNAVFEGKKTVIYFYPKDDTPTCTEEACNLRDNHHRFLIEGYQIFGISPDNAKKHRKFIDKFKLPFDLWVDEDLKLAKMFGVWGEKQLFGRKYMGIIRTSFVINEKGVVSSVIDKVHSKVHADQILT